MIIDFSIVLPFIILCFGVTGWGWRIIANRKKALSWPTIEGIVEQVQANPSENELFPHIMFKYAVNGHDYKRELRHGDESLPLNLAAVYAKKYPTGAKVKVYFDPANPENATLEPGAIRSDWILFTAGAIASLVGILALLVDIAT